MTNWGSIQDSAELIGKPMVIIYIKIKKPAAAGFSNKYPESNVLSGVRNYC